MVDLQSIQRETQAAIQARTEEEESRPAKLQALKDKIRSEIDLDAMHREWDQEIKDCAEAGEHKCTLRFDPDEGASEEECVKFDILAELAENYFRELGFAAKQYFSPPGYDVNGSLQVHVSW